MNSVTIEAVERGEHSFVEATIDDTKMNVLDLAAVSAIGEAFDLAVTMREPVVLTGRSGAFCAGLDLQVLRDGGVEAAELLDAMAAVLVQAAELPVPLVVAADGHAMGAGAMLCLVADVVLMTPGDHHIGFSEVRQGQALSVMVVELAREFLQPDVVLPATAHARMFSPVAAVAAGFVDEIVPSADLAHEAHERAARLGSLPIEAFATTKRRVRGPLVHRMRAAIQPD
jgi:enoyl-CoA hydratase